MKVNVEKWDKYVYGKVVDAFKIGEIRLDGLFLMELTSACGNISIILDYSFFEKYNPEVGGYCIHTGNEFIYLSEYDFVRFMIPIYN